MSDLPIALLRRAGFLPTRILFALPVLLALAVPSQAQSTPNTEQGRISLFGGRYSLVVGVSASVPTQPETRAAYGNVAWSPALSLWSFDRPSGLGLSWDLGGGRTSQGDRLVYLFHTGIGPRIFFAPTSANFAPYVTVRGDAYVLRVDQNDWRARPGVNAEVGASVMRHVVVSVRYDEVPRSNGVDLSGVSGRVAVKVF